MLLFSLTLYNLCLRHTPFLAVNVTAGGTIPFLAHISHTARASGGNECHLLIEYNYTRWLITVGGLSSMLLVIIIKIIIILHFQAKACETRDIANHIIIIIIIIHAAIDINGNVYT